MFWFVSLAHAAPCDLAVEGGKLPDPGLAFVHAQGALTEAGAAQVPRIACVLAARPELKLQIEVHTDAQGMDTYNQRVSQQRADALREALVAAGITPDRIAAAGCGEVYPIADNLTAEGRAKNRRIELWVDPAAAGRAFCPAVEVPPPAPPAPAPAPAPAPRVPSDCASWTALSPTRSASWPGARCDGSGAGWSCRVAVPVGDVVAAAGACFSGSWDGPEWIAPRDGFALVVTADGAGATLRAR